MPIPFQAYNSGIRENVFFANPTADLLQKYGLTGSRLLQRRRRGGFLRIAGGGRQLFYVGSCGQTDSCFRIFVTFSKLQSLVPSVSVWFWFDALEQFNGKTKQIKNVFYCVFGAK